MRIKKNKKKDGVDCQMVSWHENKIPKRFYFIINVFINKILIQKLINTFFYILRINNRKYFFL